MFGMNLLVLRCRDVDAAGRFYGCLGMTFDRHRHGNGPEYLGAEDAASAFELYPLATGATADTAGLGLAVANLAATSAALKAAGFAPGETADRPWGRTLVVRDPDGRRIEVKQG